MRALMVGMEWLPNRYGGLNRYFYGEFFALACQGVDTRALVTGVAPGSSGHPGVFGVAPDNAPVLARLRGFRTHVRSQAERGVDLIDAHFALHAVSWIRPVARRKPIVVHFHGPWADEMRAERRGAAGQLRARIAHSLEASVYRRADRVVTLSSAFGRIARERYGVPENRIRVVPGGVDLAPYVSAPSREAARRRLGWPQDRPILLSVRRLARRMGLEMLIDAVDALRRSQPRVLLLIAGKGELETELKERIARNGLEEHVRLLGFLPDADLPLAYAAADLCVVPSACLEGFGLITVESLASGTPVVGTPTGGTCEVLGSLRRELLFESTKPEEMAAKLESALLGELDLPGRDECRAYAAQYGWDAVAPSLVRVFREACEARV